MFNERNSGSYEREKTDPIMKDLNDLHDEITKAPDLLKPETFKEVDVPIDIGFSESTRNLISFLNTEWKNNAEIETGDVIYDHNRLKYLHQQSNLPYMHYKINDMKDKQGFKSIANFVNSTLIPNMNEESKLKRELKEGEEQKINLVEVIITGIASPKNPGLDPYTGKEITNDELAQLRALEIKKYFRSCFEEAGISQKSVEDLMKRIKVDSMTYESVPEGKSDSDLPGVEIHLVAAESKKILTRKEIKGGEVVSVEIE